MKSVVFVSIVIVLIGKCFCQSFSCPESDISFELTTGYVFTSPDTILDTRPSILKIEACIQLCRGQTKCMSVNYETGLCVLFSASAENLPDSLSPSQFPVFTLYAQKICLRGALQRCPDAPWSFERVKGHSLPGYVQKTRRFERREDCLASCMSTTTFSCRSANFDMVTGECTLSDMDRQSTTGLSTLQPSPNIEYYESNCIVDLAGTCQFKAVKGRILKTVDSVYQNVASVDECRLRCMNANYRCHSYDYGDTGPQVCRLSHHSTSSLLLIDEPYLEVPEATTYEMGACYNVSVECQGSYMVARVRTNRVFSGKMYGKSRPNSCKVRVEKRLDFQLYLGYKDLNCEVNQETPGKFATDIIIQHHDMVVTTNDIGLKLRCNYNLSNKTISHAAQLDINEGLSQTETEQTIVQAPNITMRITDRNGNDISTAQVGDHLALRFEIVDRITSPYEIFVRELIASDGIDASEILLVDAIGCPTDYSLIGVVQEVNGTGQVLQADFDAFKFPTSSVVQFRALVTPCIPRCDPVQCDVTDYNGNTQRLASFGRRKKREISNQLDRQPKSLDNGENIMVASVIHISDKFQLGDKSSKKQSLSETSSDWSEDVASDDGCPEVGSKGPDNTNTFAVAMGATLFLVAQCILIAVWICIFHKQKSIANSYHNEKSEDGCTTDSQPMSGNFGSLFPAPAGLLAKPNNVTSTFRDFNPYTADIFQKFWRSTSPNQREGCDNSNEAQNVVIIGGDYPSLHSVDSLSLGATLYSSLISSNSTSKKNSDGRETFNHFEELRRR